MKIKEQVENDEKQDIISKLQEENEGLVSQRNQLTNMKDTLKKEIEKGYNKQKMLEKKNEKKDEEYQILEKNTVI